MAPTIFSRKLLLPRLSVVCLAAALSLSGLFVALSDDRTGEEHSDIIHTDCSEGSLDFSAGPENARTGAPGELTCNAALCHNSFLINSGDGAFSLTVPVNFFPSDTIDILVNLSDPGQQRWGFELTALDSADNPLGDLIVAEPTRTQKSTDLLSLRQYLKHTSLGTNLGAQNVAPGWTVRWVSPFGDVGPVTFYAAGNAANGNLLNSGDFIYTTSAIVPIVSEGVRIG
ncbi:MAG: choice-of-anchor V domain-containing protein, partial [Candidatus Zixiibacteriota bacterium]